MWQIIKIIFTIIIVYLFISVLISSNKNIIDYQSICLGKNDCVFSKTKYYTDSNSQKVIQYDGGSVLTLTDCSIFDNKNWSCENDSNSNSVLHSKTDEYISVINGKFSTNDTLFNASGLEEIHYRLMSWWVEKIKYTLNKS